MLQFFYIYIYFRPCKKKKNKCRISPIPIKIHYFIAGKKIPQHYDFQKVINTLVPPTTDYQPSVLSVARVFFLFEFAYNSEHWMQNSKWKILNFSSLCQKMSARRCRGGLTKLYIFHSFTFRWFLISLNHNKLYMKWWMSFSWSANVGILILKIWLALIATCKRFSIDSDQPKNRAHNFCKTFHVWIWQDCIKYRVHYTMMIIVIEVFKS